MIVYPPWNTPITNGENLCRILAYDLRELPKFNIVSMNEKGLSPARPQVSPKTFTLKEHFRNHNPFNVIRRCHCLLSSFAVVFVVFRVYNLMTTYCREAAHHRRGVSIVGESIFPSIYFHLIITIPVRVSAMKRNTAEVKT